MSQPFVLGRLLVVESDLLHRVSGQVLQHQFAVTTEEVLAVQQQVVHELAVVVDSAVVMKLHARQLLQQPVEHGTLGQLQVRGVVDECVTFVIEAYAGGCDGHFSQHLAILVQVEGGQVALLLPAPDAVQGVAVASGVVVFAADAEDVVRGYGRHGEVEFGRLPLCLIAVVRVSHPVLCGYHRVDGHTVLGQQFHGGAQQVVVGAGILDASVQSQRLHFVFCIIGDVDLLALYLQLYGLSLAQAPDGIGHGEAVKLCMDGQLLQVVDNEVDAVARLHVTQGLKGGSKRLTVKLKFLGRK